MNKIKLVTMVACAATMFGIVGCGSKSPDMVAVGVLQAIEAGKADIDYLQKHCTEDSAKLFMMFGGEMAKEMKGATFTVINTKINGDKAKVTIKQNGGLKPEDKPHDIDLVKVDGDWKVSVNKEEKAN